MNIFKRLLDWAFPPLSESYKLVSWKIDLDGTMLIRMDYTNSIKQPTPKTRSFYHDGYYWRESETQALPSGWIAAYLQAVQSGVARGLYGDKEAP